MNNKFNLFKGPITNKQPHREITTQQLIEILTHPSTKKIINKIRTGEISKTTLSYITPAGTFLTRNNDDLVHSSGLLVIDIDKQEPTKIKEILNKDKYSHLAFTSPSGNGVKVLIKIPNVKNDYEYKEYYYSIIDYYEEKLGIIIDESGKDISRACFISHDEEYYYNPDSETYTDKKTINKYITQDLVINDDLINVIKPFWSPGNRQYLAFYLTAVMRQQGHGTKKIETTIRGIMNSCDDHDFDERLNVIKSTFDKDIDDLKGHSGLKEKMTEKAYNELVKVLRTKKEKDGDNDVLEELGLGFNDVYHGDFPPIEWLIPSIIMNQGSFTFLAGQGGKFKTYLSLFMTKSLLTGEDFLGRPVKDKCKVLYIDEESGRGRIKERLRKIIKNTKGINNEDFLLYDFTGKFCFDDEGINRLEQVIRNFRPKVVFMDSLTRLFMGKENSADETKVILNYLKGLYVKYDCAFIVIHHFNKNQESGNRLRGSSELIAAPDVIVILEEEATNKFKFYHDKLRDGVKNEVTHFEVIDSDDNRTIDIRVTGMSELNVRRSPFEDSKNKIKNYVFEEGLSGEIVKSSLFVEQGFVSKNMCRKVMDSLCKEKIFVLVKQGEYEVINSGLGVEEPMR